MPIYEYECLSCGHKFQLLQRFTDKPPSSCPNCGAEGNIKKLVSETMFELKGSGWYATDYKNNNTLNKGASGSLNKTKQSKSTSQVKEEKSA